MIKALQLTGLVFFVLLLVSLIFSSNFYIDSPTGLVPGSCNDTDGGNNPNVFGTVTKRGASYSDYCASSSTVIEYYCNRQNIESGTFSCPNGCLNGACRPAQSMCGNGIVETGETCDGTNLNGQTCQSRGFSGGTLSCAPNCLSYNTSACYTCGNNVRQTGEVCDGSDLGSQTCITQGFNGGTLSCSSNCLSFNTNNCTNTVCGNSVCQQGETELNCSVDCTVCGNGICGEQENQSNCPQDCTICGDGYCQAGETQSNCSLDCQLTACLPGHLDNGNGTCTAEFVSASSDGRIGINNQTTWANAHDNVGGITYGGSLGTVSSFVNSTPAYYISRTFLPFDTSILPENIPVVQVQLSLYVTSKTSTDSDTQDFAGVLKSTQTSPLSLTGSDFDNCGTLVNPISGGSLQLSAIPSNAHATFLLNETGRTFVNSSGWTLLCLRSGNDILNLTPVNGGDTVIFSTFEETVATKRPKLKVTYQYLSAVCGNGSIEYGEDCDGVNLDLQTCQTQGFADGGTLSCKPDCTFNTSGCFNAGCGNGAVGPNEECDGSNFAGKTCVSEGFVSGNLSCSSQCTINTNPCNSGLPTSYEQLLDNPRIQSAIEASPFVDHGNYFGVLIQKINELLSGNTAYWNDYDHPAPYTDTELKEVILSKVAVSIHVEAIQQVPWRLLDYSDEDLRLLLGDLYYVGAWNSNTAMFNSNPTQPLGYGNQTRQLYPNRPAFTPREFLELLIYRMRADGWRHLLVSDGDYPCALSDGSIDFPCLETTKWGGSALTPLFMYSVLQTNNIPSKYIELLEHNSIIFPSMDLILDGDGLYAAMYRGILITPNQIPVNHSFVTMDELNGWNQLPLCQAKYQMSRRDSLNYLGLYNNSTWNADVLHTFCTTSSQYPNKGEYLRRFITDAQIAGLYCQSTNPTASNYQAPSLTDSEIQTWFNNIDVLAPC